MDEQNGKTAGERTTARGGAEEEAMEKMTHAGECGDAMETAKTVRPGGTGEAWRRAEAERAVQRAGEEAGEECSVGERVTQRAGWRSAEEWRGKRWREGEEILGRYVVEGELGQGGMGVVYGCLDKVGGVRVAVKALPPELSHNSVEMEEVRENFRLVSGLRHTNITGVRTLEKDGKGEYFLVMDVAEGVSLRKWLREKRHKTGDGWSGVPLEEALPILRQVAAALDYAHGERVVHRDVKPGNVMIDGRGRAKVLDFGLAAQIRTSLSRASQAYRGTSGTGPYMAPEQWRAEPQDAKTDQYALAVMAYEMLAGRLPFENGEIAVLREAVLREEPKAIQGLSKGAMAALRRGMAKEAGKRFGSCGEFVEALGGKSGRRSVRSPTLMEWGAVLVGAVLLMLAAVDKGVWRRDGKTAGEPPSPPAEARQDAAPLEEDVEVRGQETSEKVIAAPEEADSGLEAESAAPEEMAGAVETDLRRLESLEEDTLEARIEVLEWKTRLDALEGLDGDALMSAAVYLANDPALRSIRQQYQEAKVSMVVMMRGGMYGERHPDVLRLKGAIDELERQLITALDGLKARLRVEYEVAKKQHDSLEEELSALKSRRGEALGAGSPVGGSERLDKLEKETDAARCEMLAWKTRLDALEGLEGDSLWETAVSLASDQALMALRQQYQNAKASLDVMMSDGMYGERHPDVLRLKGAIDELERQLNTALDGLKIGLRVEYEVAKERHDLLKEELDTLKSRCGGTESADIL